MQPATLQRERLFAYIWRCSRGEQLRVLAVVLLSMPFYYASLDVPKLIVTDAIQGRAFQSSATAPLFRIVSPWSGAVLFPGIEFDRTSYLFALSGLFLALVLVNGAFKYVINMRKGALGERVLQRLRFELFAALVARTPDAGRRISASEAATIIKDEVEPVGGFVGDAFIQPIFLFGQAATALAFILIQSLPLGICAGALVGVQAVIIPRLRREQLRLGRMRQLQSRALAGRIGEVVDGLDEVRNHGAAPYEMSRIAGRLEELFSIRYRLYGRKFAAKFANNLLAQATPFLFYSLGGYFALRGELAIGQLVAVIAAYRDLPPPVKELIDWDQQRMDVEVKFQQVVEQFPALDAPAATGALTPAEPAGAVLAAVAVELGGSPGEPGSEKASLTIAPGDHVALFGPHELVSALASALAGRRRPASGHVSYGDNRLDQMDDATLGRLFAYAGPDPAVFAGTFRDNLLYGLRRGGDAEWLDLEAAGVSSPEELGEAVLRVVRVVDLEADMRRAGLAARIDPAAEPDLAARIVAARDALADGLAAANASDLVERFDPERYGERLSIRENLLFGPLPEPEAASAAPPFLAVTLYRLELGDALEAIGRGFAATMVEIFADFGPQSLVVQRFAFMSAEALDGHRRALERHGLGRATSEDRLNFLMLALRYCEPVHRLGLLDDALRARILAARPAVAEAAAAAGVSLPVYDPAAYTPGASLRDNLLFGRVVSEAPSAGERLAEALEGTLAQTGLTRVVLDVGLDQPVGPGGRELYATQRAALALGRCLLKRPAVLVIDGALQAYGDARGAQALAAIRAFMHGRTLVAACGPGVERAGFTQAIELGGGRARIRAGARESAPEPARPEAMSEEVRALRAVPMLASLETARLKLLAFTGERVTFAPGHVLMRQGDEAHDALVLLSGDATVWIQGDAGALRLGVTEPGAIVGEMGALTRGRRAATVTANTPVRALRIRRDVLTELVLEYPDFGLRLLQAQIQRTAEVERRLLEARNAGAPPEP